mmetsp:Transcript_3758/g.11042  ORF Transcript_3758/g.11042 Transcript_3758/m.11042 type:complete len:173 (+) Transcript_3758:1361-1879(+)
MLQRFSRRCCRDAADDAAEMFPARPRLPFSNESVIDGDCLQDDLVSVVSFERRAVVARAQGHSSWVHHVAFEPAPLQEGKDRPPASHAFASVGADGRICFWEFRADGKGEDGGGPPPNGADVPSPGFREVPLLAPLASVPLHERPVAALLYGRGEMHTACAGGFVKTFARVS